MEAETVGTKVGWRVDWLERALEFDFTRPLAFAALAVVYVVSRIPWLGIGYGADPDAWRVALSADHLLSHAEYLPSRLPGFPLEEFVTVPLVRFGWVATNLSTVFISLVGVYFFARLLVELKLPARGILTPAFAFTPLLWINSVLTMDYMWSLTFILACYLALIRRRPLLAGVCIGLAIGFRLTAFTAAFAFLFWIWREHRLRWAPPFIGAMGVVSLAAYSPVLATYGIGMFNFYDAKIPFLGFLNLLGKDALGLIGAIAVIAGALLSLPRLKRLPWDFFSDSHVALWIVLSALVFASFTRLPHEVAYLIPLYPFGFFLMARYFRLPVLSVVLAVVVLAGFVDITSPNSDHVNKEKFTGAQIGAGMVLSDLNTMTTQRAYADDLAAVDIPPHSVVFIGTIFPQFAMRNKDRLELGILERDHSAISMLTDRGEAVDTAKDVHYVWLLKYDTFEAFRQQGYQFFYVHDAEGGNAVVFHYRPAYFGATEVLKGRTPVGNAKGTASTNR
ncbi:MAG: hypothetical protein ABSC13_02175 [Dehalococcoidia bacterium]|jgi:hypothetical protein